MSAFLPALVVGQTINPVDRTITTSNFAVTWNTGVDTEAITALNWKGSANITGSVGLNSCYSNGIPGAVEYWANSEVPPDPQNGGLVLVGGGTVTPAGKSAWLGQILNTGILQVTVNSSSVNCLPSSAGVNVQTTYRFFNPKNAGVNWFQVQRVFDFSESAFDHPFRPYVPRPNASAYSQVLYPTTSGTLAAATVSNCDSGCTGPQSAPGAAPLSPAWDPRQGWFAIHDPATLTGVVVKRENSTILKSEISPQLWLDYDQGPPINTNASSFLLFSPSGGFGGGVVTETETLCFYNKAIWQPSLVPPIGCRLAQLAVVPSTLTFASEFVGITATPQTALVKNGGASAVKILDVSASGDFAQSNDCPPELAAGAFCTVTVFFRPAAAGIQSGSISIFDVLGSSPLTISLAGFGVAPQ